MNQKYAERLAQMGISPEKSAHRWCNIAVKDIDRSNGAPEILALATTADIDLEGEVVVPEGLDPSPFQKNKTVYLNHNYWDREAMVGSMRNVKLDKGRGGWLVRVKMASTPSAQETLTLIEEEVINGGSIGFERIDSGALTEEEVEKYGPANMITRKGRWFEWSVTAMPCNPFALIQRGAPVLSDEKAGALDNLVRKGRVSLEFAKLVGLPPERAGKPRRILVV